MSVKKRALISVSNKAGVVEFAQGLSKLGFEIISTGGTAKALKESGLSVISISDVTGFPEMLDGRVKTLHPKVHGGLLGIRDNADHQKQMQENGIDPIDVVAVNLYPFQETIAKPDVTLEEAIENIDIGGPAMIRSAAKNHKDVLVVVNPDKYSMVVDALSQGNVTLELKQQLALEVFQHTAQYDQAIANYLSQVSSEKEAFPESFQVSFQKVSELRYGENPHQKGAFYKESKTEEPCVANAIQKHGKELSFNNLLDLNSALELVKEFSEPAAIVIKHNNPCGAAVDKDLVTAYVKAYETDPVSAFGGVMGFNRVVDEATALEISKIFVEAIIAPGYDAKAFDILAKKKNIRLMELAGLGQWVQSKEKNFIGQDIKRVVGGLLIQDRDVIHENGAQLNSVAARQPTEEELKSMQFAWKVAKHVRSNAIVFVRGTETVGVGAGQMSRVDSARLAVEKANKPIKGCVVASDAFFPFRDGVDQVIDSGATAVIQPGGSVRDEEVIAACNEKNAAMVFTGLRHFKH